jgi:hypothetical protein
VETASGVDRDDEEHVETQRLTGRDCGSIQCMIQCMIINSVFFCSYKVHNFYTTSQMPSGDGL